MKSELWQEVYVSAILRSLSIYVENPAFSSNLYVTQLQEASIQQQLLVHISIRCLNPFATETDEDRFLVAAKNLFRDGWMLGSHTGDSVPQGSVDNNLSRIVFEYFRKTNSFEKAVLFFSEIDFVDPEITTFIAPNLISRNDDISTVEILCSSLLKSPLKSAPLLKAQAKFLWDHKKNFDLALDLLNLAIEIAPADTDIWLDLAELYGERSEYDLALETLNLCPMFLQRQNTITDVFSLENGINSGVTSSLGEILRLLPQVHRCNFPTNEDAVISSDLYTASSPSSGPNSSVSAADILNHFIGLHSLSDACDVSLYRLQAIGLRGAIRRAYSLLASFVKSLGWNDLLKIREDVFVMENEYNYLRQKSVPNVNRFQIRIRFYHIFRK